MRRRKSKPYRIIGAYDSETTNLVNGMHKEAFPILHQLGILDGTPIEAVTCGNVERVTHLHMYRHTVELYAALDAYVAQPLPYVPVICVHNLAFDMYGLAGWLSAHTVTVLAKSQRKPIAFTVCDDEDEEARLVIWDTLGFSGKALGTMGEECGFPKLRGDWDYNLIRTPSTPLTDREIAYGAHDIYTLLAWLGYWCRMNPDINPEDLGHSVTTKTGVVRQRRKNRFSKLKGEGLSRSCGEYWMLTNMENAPTSDDELFTMEASTRGGFTFCARENASRVFDFEDDDPRAVYGFDATSQHPSQMVSHFIPQHFKKMPAEALFYDFKAVQATSLDDVLEHYAQPFGCAFDGVFEFTNLRLKPGSPFGDFGIAPLASARCKSYQRSEAIAEDNQNGEDYREFVSNAGYKDTVSDDATFAFGKLESASTARLYLTELAAWEVCQAYDFDSVEAVEGYGTGRFQRPTDFSVISVMQFYAAKNAFKHAKGLFEKAQPLDNPKELQGYGVPEYVINGMNDGTIDPDTVAQTYQALKADLNALYGIEVCNEFRRSTELTEQGITYVGDFGIENAPTHPKTFYQFGQRVVGWSRVAQCIVMMLVYPYVDTIVNGDTDSVKLVIKAENYPKVVEALKRHNAAIDAAKRYTCARVEKAYPDYFSSLDGIGYYVLEFTAKRFCASWNKAYCIEEHDPRDDRDHVRFTLAGVPTKRVNAMADDMRAHGATFGEVCDLLLGYNVTYSEDMTQLNARSFPEWGAIMVKEVTDYQGQTTRVAEPVSLCLYPMSKTINDTTNATNAGNLIRAMKNRPTVNSDPVIIAGGTVIRLEF